jgi:hypothetical protein
MRAVASFRYSVCRECSWRPSPWGPTRGRCRVLFDFPVLSVLLHLSSFSIFFLSFMAAAGARYHRRASPAGVVSPLKRVSLRKPSFATGAHGISRSACGPEAVYLHWCACIRMAFFAGRPFPRLSDGAPVPLPTVSTPDRTYPFCSPSYRCTHRIGWLRLWPSHGGASRGGLSIRGGRRALRRSSFGAGGMIRMLSRKRVWLLSLSVSGIRWRTPRRCSGSAGGEVAGVRFATSVRLTKAISRLSRAMDSDVFMGLPVVPSGSPYRIDSRVRSCAKVVSSDAGPSARRFGHLHRHIERC